MPQATKEYPLMIRVPEEEKDLWSVIVQNEDKIKALYDSGFFGVDYGKVTINMHDNQLVNVTLEKKTYQKIAVVIPVIHRKL